MSVSKNWTATSISGFTGNEIIVNGQANNGKLDALPVLDKRIPQGINSSILQLNLLNAADALPENFKDAQYNEKIETIDQYQTVEIFHGDEEIQSIKVVIKN